MAAGRHHDSGVGARVRATRKRLGLRRRRVAHNAGFSRRELAAVERGRRTPTVDEVRSLAGSLGVEVDELLAESGHPELDQPSPGDVRIEDVLEDSLETAFEDVPAAEPLPELAGTRRRERRRVPRARGALEKSFDPVRTRLAHVARCCERLGAADADDDVGALIDDLEHSLARLRANENFERVLEQHRDTLVAYRRSLREAKAASWQSRGAEQPG